MMTEAIMVGSKGEGHQRRLESAGQRMQGKIEVQQRRRTSNTDSFS
jgi:hypothetical protein